MAEKKIFVSVYVDEESILGKIAEIDSLTSRMSRATSELRYMLTHKSTADSNEEPAAENK